VELSEKILDGGDWWDDAMIIEKTRKWSRHLESCKNVINSTLKQMGMGEFRDTVLDGHLNKLSKIIEISDLIDECKR
jgi:hypothetical protein